MFLKSETAPYLVLISVVHASQVEAGRLVEVAEVRRGAQLPRRPLVGRRARAQLRGSGQVLRCNTEKCVSVKIHS